MIMMGIHISTSVEHGADVKINSFRLNFPFVITFTTFPFFL